jgi:FkbM family methyltransferase
MQPAARLLDISFHRPGVLVTVARLAWARLTGAETIRFRSEDLVFEQTPRFGAGMWAALAGLKYDDDLPTFVDMLHEGDVVLDLGANVGAYTLRAARKVGPGGRVVAVEPLSEAVELLRRNIRHNRFANITVIEAAVCDRDGDTVIHVGPRLNSASLVKKAGAPRTIRAVTVDRLVADLGLPRVDVVKMDIEKAESLALAGMRMTIERYSPLCLFENSTAARATLEGLGYETGTFTRAGIWARGEHGLNLWAKRAATRDGVSRTTGGVQ